VEPFQIEVVGLGTFGRPGFPRVIWAGVRPSAPLMRLQERVTVAVGALGLKVEDREYRPHVTLGRVRSPSDGGRLMEILEEMKGREFGSVNVDDVSLMESVLKPHRSEYSVLCSVHLAPGSR